MTRAALAKAILRLHKQGEPLNISAVKRNHPHLLTAAYSFTPFLGWKQALDLAGLDYDTIRIELESYVQCQVCGNYFKALGNHIRMIHGYSDKAEYFAEFPGAHLASETLRASITHMRSSLPKWEPNLSMEYVLDRVWHWHQNTGHCYVQFIFGRDPSIISYVFKMGVKWDDVIRKVGLDPKQTSGYQSKYPDRAAVIEAIQARHRLGLSIFQNVVAVEDMALKCNAYTHCGGWTRALQLAGLLVAHRQVIAATVRKDAVFSSAKETLSRLKERANAGQGISQHRVSIEELPLKSAVYRYFGSWPAAIQAAGLDALLLKQKRHAMANRVVMKYPTKQSITSELIRRAAAGMTLTLTQVILEDINLKHAAYRVFGSWREAINAAGVRKFYEQNTRVILNYRNEKSVLQAIRKRHRSGKSISIGVIQKEESALKNAAYRHLGSWTEAVRLALANQKGKTKS